MTAHAHPHPHSHSHDGPTAGHDHDLASWRHSHVFDAGNRRGELRTRIVLALTIVTMAVEIVAGWMTGSMALLADGWHMGTHAIALGVAAAAYALARRHAGDARFTFGTWKIEVLGGFASAIVLGIVALGVFGESAVRLYESKPIALQAAMLVAVVGLVVNLLSAWLLHGADDGHGHSHGHDHGHAHHDHHDHDHHDHAAPAKSHDLNLRAAYVHVAADALTSVLAIAALAAAMWLGWWWLDPLVGLGGAVVIALWSVGLMRQSGAILLDREKDPALADRVRAEIESDGDARVADLHVWRVGRDKFAAIASIVADRPLEPSVYRARLSKHAALAHVSIEVNRCVMSQHPH